MFEFYPRLWFDLNISSTSNIDRKFKVFHQIKIWIKHENK